MDIAKLPFDADTMLAGLRPGSNARARPSTRRASIAMLDLAARDCAVAGATVERIAGRMGFGDCVRATFSFGHAPQPGILIMGHFDTVHPVGTLSALPFRRDGEKCYGPGIFDMKGGNYLALDALRMLQRLGLAPALPVTFLFTRDEEVGSPVDARPDRGGSRAAQIHPGAGARSCRRRRRHRALRDRALQPRIASGGRATPARA